MAEQVQEMELSFEDAEGEDGLVTSPFVNTGLSYRSVHPTKHEQSKSDYL
jgi:hypothetical protein